MGRYSIIKHEVEFWGISCGNVGLFIGLDTMSSLALGWDLSWRILIFRTMWFFAARFGWNLG